VFDSVLAQTYRNFEWIIVNDCSTDDSDNVIRGLLKTVPSYVNVQYYINEKNLGKHRSWNRALKLATGDLWICCDCDDSFAAQSLEILNERWNLVSEDDSFCGINSICKDPLTGEIRGSRFPEDNFISNKLRLATVDNVPGEKWDCTRIDLLRKRPFPEVEGSFFTEVYVWWMLAHWGYKLLCINEPLRDYWYEPNSLMNNRVVNLRRVRQRRLASRWYLSSECKWYLWRHAPKFMCREFAMFCFTSVYAFACRLLKTEKL
jgi:glycosyltransferase involved in cell wall biosynthesis